MPDALAAEKARIRAEAEAFFTTACPISMSEVGYYDASTRGIAKAGVVPFYCDEGGKLHFYLMKPKPNTDREYDNQPQFQVCKGTREYQYQGADGTTQWGEYGRSKDRKMQAADKPEPLLVTAIREGVEEIGLPPEAIKRTFEWGRATYVGAKEGRLNSMWLYAVEVEADTAFRETSEALAKTEKREWFAWPPSPEKTNEIRNDYVNLLDTLAPALSEAMDKAVTHTPVTIENSRAMHPKKIDPKAIKAGMVTLQNNQR